ncbi:hypothetical protein [Carnobacterium maltaromaticum]|uniref:hypothetical protein n=1 Tax=Carnobacterium maltaromaticum TaxID=2751 RepID=UPI0012FA3A73|nr:hypothetical protein [Carnobacterium maltaromaticum]
MVYVHVIQTLSDTEIDAVIFSSKDKAMKNFNFYIEEFQNQENTKLIRSEKSLTVVTDDKDEEHIFSAEYMRKVVR